LVAARVVPAVDNRVTTTTGVDAVGLFNSRVLAAPVRPVIVDTGSTAGRVTAIYAAIHRAAATAEGNSVVVDVGATASSV